MKHSLLFLGLLLSSFAFTQQQTDTLYLSKANLHLFDENILAIHTVVFLDESNTINSSEKSKPHTDDQFIKDWLGYNQQVKIVTRSYFESLNEERKQVYIDYNCLILAGEKITIWDIKNYEQN